MIHFLLSTAEIYPKVYHTCFFIVTYFAPLCLMVLAYIQICHKLWFQQVCGFFLLLLGFFCLFISAFRVWCTHISFLNRYLGTHRWCRGSGGPCSVPFQVQPKQSPRGLEPARYVPRSNRSEPGARRLACWWWCCLCLRSAISPSASSTSWKGNHSGCSRDEIKSLRDQCRWDKHCFYANQFPSCWRAQSEKVLQQRFLFHLILPAFLFLPAGCLGVSRMEMTERQCMHGLLSPIG